MREKGKERKKKRKEGKREGGGKERRQEGKNEKTEKEMMECPSKETITLDRELADSVFLLPVYSTPVGNKCQRCCPYDIASVDVFCYSREPRATTRVYLKLKLMVVGGWGWGAGGRGDKMTTKALFRFTCFKSWLQSLFLLFVYLFFKTLFL